jgi:hypothetical protein
MIRVTLAQLTAALSEWCLRRAILIVAIDVRRIMPKNPTAGAVRIGAASTLFDQARIQIFQSASRVLTVNHVSHQVVDIAVDQLHRVARCDVHAASISIFGVATSESTTFE